MRKSILVFLAFLLSYSLTADTTKDRVDAYVARYADLAVSEMYRSGIPASITLAQGLLESGFGRSTLALESNNHFGIKCHSDWTGERVYYDDDKKGECFRKYPKVLDSYMDHSDFLRYKPRYASLFDFEITDYRSWANGLKKAGYATDPAYAGKLINLIETYNLDRFDKVSRPEDAMQQEEVLPQSPNVLEKASRYTGSGRRGSFAVSLSREVLQINDIPFIYAREGETFKSIAQLYDLFPKELMAFNDVKKDRALASGEVIYLRPKAKRAVKGLEKHICSEGENLWQISQKYAVSLQALLKYNHLKSADVQLREDDTINLRNQKNG